MLKRYNEFINESVNRGELPTDEYLNILMEDLGVDYEILEYDYPIFYKRIIISDINDEIKKYIKRVQMKLNADGFIIRTTVDFKRTHENTIKSTHLLIGIGA